MKKQLNGIALVLFGILLCCADSVLSKAIFGSGSEGLFSILGVLFGIIGLFLAFRKTKNQ